MSEQNCPIREHTGDGAYVGRCEFFMADGKTCPRHGLVSDYPTYDDREVAPPDRRFPDDVPRRRGLLSRLRQVMRA